MAEHPQNVARPHSPNLLPKVEGQIGHEGLNILQWPSGIINGSICSIGVPIFIAARLMVFTVKAGEGPNRAA